MKDQSPLLFTLALATLLALTPAGFAQAQQSQQADSLQQLADSLQQTAQRLQQTAQQLEQTARRLAQMNTQMQRQQASPQQGQQLANVPADTSGRVAQQQAGQQASAPSLDETLSKLEGDITQVDPNAATQLVQGWAEALRERDEQVLVSLASDLEQLQEELEKESIVGQRVGQLLTQIGEKTTEAASSAGSSDAQKLRQLGRRLSDAGGQLSSGQTSGSGMQQDTTGQGGMQQDTTSMQQDTTAQQGGQAANRSQQQADLNATLVAFERDVTGLDPVMAVGNIDGWIKALRESDEQGLGSIADDLEQLKSELQKESVDGQKVGELLNTLGEQTTQAASKADPALSPQLLQLGSLLSDAGGQLSGGQGGGQGGMQQDTTGQGGMQQDTTRNNR